MARDDKRYTRTHEEIRRVFKELILEKEFREITVSEIARRADVNRKTFYRHYDSIYSVLEELQEEIMGDLSGLQEYYTVPLNMEQYKVFVKGFLTILSSNKALHKRLFCNSEYRFVFDRIRTTMTGRIVDSIDGLDKADTESRQLFIDFISYGFLFVVRDWLSADKPLPVEEFAEYASQILFYSGKGILENS